MRILLSVATALPILAVALLLLFTPIWTHFALTAVGNGQDARLWQSDQTINEVLFGPGTFQIEPCSGCITAGNSFYTRDEVAHMQDVRVVFDAFLVVAGSAFVFLVLAVSRRASDPSAWRAVARGGLGLVFSIVVLGLFAAFAFDAAFTLFHEIFFPGGNWSFPADSNLIRVYPEPFWELTSAALAILSIAGGLAVWLLARRRATGLVTAPA